MTYVLLHGFTGSPASWDAVAARLPGQVVAEPLCGHAPGITCAGFAEEVERLTARLSGIPDIHLVGYSMGARVALGLLVSSARFRRATLIGVNPGLRSEAERAARRSADAAWIELLETRGLGAFTAAWDAQPLFAGRPPRRLAHDPAGLAAALRALGLGAMPDLWPALPRIAVPVTLVAGERDTKFRLIAARVRDRIPRSRLAVVRSTGHDPVGEDPAAVAALLTEETPT